ncbi:hypothetical protein BK121_15710 [Paenibacillus odorifer]|nr:hypothetical protein BK121_15710 [Paenibacillus odorifer]OMD94937.1 hypothetical protein BSK54_27225 [Paenibacillus odorifer]
MSNSKSRHMMNRSYIKEVIRELKVIGHEDDRAKEILINTVVKRGEGPRVRRRVQALVYSQAKCRAKVRELPVSKPKRSSIIFVISERGRSKFSSKYL